MKAIYLTLLTIFLTTALFGQHKVSGIVKDDAGLEMIGVTIVEKGDASNGTITDIDGTYSMEVSSDNATLIISYTGFETMEILVDGKPEVSIILSDDVLNLDEVIVVGYTTQKKAVTTGAIAHIDSEDLENFPLTRVEQSLAGRTAGVRVTTNSGAPGASASVNIRGITSINGSSVLYVVDGVPIEGGIDFLNQNDIATIDVLKDGASAAIYGTRGAGGVVLITTKKGEKGKMKVSYHGYYGTQSPWRKLRLLNSTEYATLLNEASAAAGQPIPFEDPQSLGEGTDWQDAIFADDAPWQNHELSVSGGSDKSTFYASFGFNNQEGIVATDDSKYERYTVRLNADHQINDKLKFGSSLSYAKIRSQGVSENGEFGSPLGRAINIDPITPIYETREDVLNSSVYQNFPVVGDENGLFGISELVTSEIVNPLAAQEVQQGFGWSDKFVANLYAEWEIIKGLKLRSNYGTDIAFWGGEGFTPIHYLNATNRVDQTSLSRNVNRGRVWNWETTLSYKRDFKGHSLFILAGTGALKNRTYGTGGNITDVPYESLDDASFNDLFAPIENQSFYGWEGQNRLSSFFGRLDYNYKEKYLLSALYRIDGSSNFLRTRQFAQFPSLSLGWIVSEEDFFGKNPYVNFLKIRSSYGNTGSQNIDANSFISTIGDNRTYTFGVNDDLVNGSSPNRIANPLLEWETTSQFNIGFDSKIFRKFAFTFDYFIKETTGILQRTSVPGFLGNDGPWENIGSMENRGYEFELSYLNKFGNLNFEISGNASYLENEITFLTRDVTFRPGQRYGPQGLEISRTTVGQPFDHFFGFKTDGLFQNQAEVDAHVGADGSLLQSDAAPGDIRFVDFNQDGMLDDEDRTMIGDPTPSWTYGFTLNASYKGFELLLFGQGVAGNDVMNRTRRFDLPKANYTADALGRWTGEGTSNYFPRLHLDDPNKNFSRSSDFFVENGAYFRIKTLQIAYNLPKSLLDKLKLDKFRVYISGNNLWTKTDYNGFDPEIGAGNGIDRGIYPQPRSFLTGLQIGF